MRPVEARNCLLRDAQRTSPSAELAQLSDMTCFLGSDAEAKGDGMSDITGVSLILMYGPTAFRK